MNDGRITRLNGLLESSDRMITRFRDGKRLNARQRRRLKCIRCKADAYRTKLAQLLRAEIPNT